MTTTTTIDIKAHIRDAIRDEWPAFRDRHPYLADCLDQELLVVSVARSLEQDDEYRKAMDQAAAMGLLGQTAAGIVRGFAADFLRRIMG